MSFLDSNELPNTACAMTTIKPNVPLVPAMVNRPCTLTNLPAARDDFF
jgi:hypothetical protein